MTDTPAPTTPETGTAEPVPGATRPGPVPAVEERARFEWYPKFTRSPSQRVLGGVASGLAEHFGTDTTKVRIVFVVLAVLLSGGGFFAYVALWVMTPARDADAADVATSARGSRMSAEAGRRQRRLGYLLVMLGLVGSALTFSAATATGIAAVVPIVVIAVGAILVWQEYDRGPGKSRSAFEWARITGGSTLVVAGLAVVVIGQVDLATLQSSLIAVVATLVGVGLLTVPLWLRMWHTVEGERAARVREAERSDIASHLHDSVLQTLALIQKRSADPLQVSRLARRQERELRQWLFGSDDRMSSGSESLAGAVETLCGDIEDTYELRVSQVVVGGDTPVGEQEEAALGAVRESLVNVAKHAEVETADVFVEVDDEVVSAFVRDRGRGFDPEDVPADRQGLAGSVRHRVESRGGTVRIRSTLGRGTEIGIEMPRTEE